MLRVESQLAMRGVVVAAQQASKQVQCGRRKDSSGSSEGYLGVAAFQDLDHGQACVAVYTKYVCPGKMKVSNAIIQRSVAVSLFADILQCGALVRSGGGGVLSK